jgi:amino acid permease
LFATWSTNFIFMQAGICFFFSCLGWFKRLSRAKFQLKKSDSFLSGDLGFTSYLKENKNLSELGIEEKNKFMFHTQMFPICLFLIIVNGVAQDFFFLKFGCY